MQFDFLSLKRVVTCGAIPAAAAAPLPLTATLEQMNQDTGLTDILADLHSLYLIHTGQVDPHFHRSSHSRHTLSLSTTMATPSLKTISASSPSQQCKLG